MYLVGRNIEDIHEIAGSLICPGLGKFHIVLPQSVRRRTSAHPHLKKFLVRILKHAGELVSGCIELRVIIQSGHTPWKGDGSKNGVRIHLACSQVRRIDISYICLS